jgi:hypothetical protein
MKAEADMEAAGARVQEDEARVREEAALATLQAERVASERARGIEMDRVERLLAIAMQKLDDETAAEREAEELRLFEVAVLKVKTAEAEEAALVFQIERERGEMRAAFDKRCEGPS